ncbi:MFS transporter [Paenibacillus sp. CCS19]|uniref:MFS transporter n=1 Tax=Paenibacillus sp. CCS19 TaxID=3158387 RepID=UPI002563D434|nr:MFS transporter [Paenibacillus cellulosilyticus]GMK40636.1 MFS transporter [Paenibacillus cellulosilyticus]
MQEAMVQTRSVTRSSKLVLLLGISLGYFMVLLDMTVVSVALPAIHSDLGGGMSDLQWVVNAYTIVFAGLMLSMGTLTDKFGARSVFICGLILILITSGIAAAATSIGALITMRAVLGVGGAALLPASLALIAHAYPDPGERARALGIWAAVTGIALAAGPVVGGMLVDSLGWRSIFLLNMPIALVSLVITWFSIHKTVRNPHRNLDGTGQFLAIVTIVALCYALMEGESQGWNSALILVAFGLALASAIVLIVVEARSKAPLIPLQLFRSRSLSAGMTAGMLINIGMSGILFIIPMFFQQERGLAAHTAGLALLPMMIPMAINPIFTGRIVSRRGPRLPMTFGFAAAALGTLLLALLNAATSYWLTLAGLFLLGYGISLTIPALMAAVISSVPKDQVGIASGMINSSRQLGATLGVAMTGIIVSGSQSFLTGMHTSFTITAIVLVGGSLLSYLMVGRRERKS